MGTVLAEEIFSFVLAMSIIGILFGVVYANSDNLAFHQEFYVRDISFTINSMLSVDGEVVVAYPISDPYEVSLDKDNADVIVSVKDYERRFPYIPSKNFNIKLEKKGKLLVISRVEI